MIFIRDENMIRETDKRSLDRFPNRIRLDQNLLTSHPTCGIIWRTVVAKLRPEVFDNRGPGHVSGPGTAVTGFLRPWSEGRIKVGLETPANRRKHDP